MQWEDSHASPPPLRTIAREWGRIGCIGFGGPPTHITLLRELCVGRRGWLSPVQFERGLAGVNLLPGPASTQLAIYCAWRLRGRRGALLGGACFIVPGLVAILLLSILFLSGSPPRWVRGAAAGAGAAVAVIAVRAGIDVARPLWARSAPGRRPALLAFGIAGALAAALAGAWLVLVLLGCGLLALALGGGAGAPGPGAASWLAGGASDLIARAGHMFRTGFSADGLRLLASAVADPGGIPALAWTALKVGGLAFGGGFVIVPLMQTDAVTTYHWMTHAQFLDAVVLGQITPGPVTLTVAAVGYGAYGLGGGLLAALVAFLPSFLFIILGASHFERLLGDDRVRAFLSGAAPAAAGAIVGASVPLTAALSEGWQLALSGACAVALLVARRGVLQTLLLAGGVGVAVAVAGGPTPA